MPVYDVVGSRSLVRSIEANGRLLPDRTFLEFGDQRMTYGAFASGVRKVANGLLKLNVSAGDRVLVYLPNCPEFLIVRFAIQRIGAIFVTCSTLFKPDEILYELEHSEPVLAVTDTPSLEMIRDLAGRVPSVKHILTLDPWALESGDADVNRMLASIADSLSLAFPSVDSVATFMYTSGTTARPKAVILTHGNEFMAALNMGGALSYVPSDRLLHYFPMYHANGGLILLAPIILRAATIVLIPKFSASGFAQTLVEKGITITAMNSTHVKMILNNPPTPYDNRHGVKRVMFALPLDAERRAEFSERFGGITLVEVYGLTEATGVCTSCPTDSLWKAGSAGLPLPGYQIKLVDDNGEEVPPGSPGEVLIQSITRHGVCRGYHKNPDATAELLQDGWLHSGDVGFVDEDGYFWFLERKKDMIKRSGFNVAAAEVERVLLDHPTIREAAVVGIPDEMREEAIVAFVVPSAGQVPVPDDLIRFCAKSLADYKVPEFVTVLDALPENFLGKVEKKKLREMALTAHQNR